MSELIPVHHFSSDRIPIGVEQIKKIKKAMYNEVHRHDFHEIFLFTEGKGEHMIDLEHHHFKAPSCHIVAPGQVHQLTREAGSAGVVIMFAGDLDLALANKAKRSLFGPGDKTKELSKTQLNEATTLAANIEIELNSDRAIAVNYLGILLLKCLEWGDQTNQQEFGGIDAVDRFQLLVDDHFQKERKVVWFADQLNISAGHLSDLCNKRLGKSASAVIKDRTLLEAKRLLLHSELSIKEIAYTLNMQDPAYFTRMFKKGTNKGPLQFREHIREKYK